MKIVTKLLKWYRKEGRDLPWRHTTDPYCILVSEIMLQQTQVARGLLFYEKWLKQFPDWKSLAAASNADVIHAWAGLGYNRRAIMLRDIAKQVVELGVPESEEQWRALKGIGPYTSAALTVFSLRQKAVPIDTNIRRVIGRLFLGKPYPQPEDDADIASVIDEELMETKEFYDVPQGLFDLATMHCTKMPDCSACPLRNDCKSSNAFLSGTVVAPKQMVKKAKEHIRPGKKHPDRIYRGRILSCVRKNEGVKENEIGPEIDPAFTASDKQWVSDMITRLERDGMLRRKRGRLYLVSED